MTDELWLMPFDIVLPSILFFLTAASVYLYPKLEKKVKSLVEERKFTMRDVVFLVVLMSVEVTVMVFIPAYAILAIFLSLYAIALFTFTYTATSKWYIALIVPAIFLLSYVFVWGIPQMDLFAAIFIVFISIYVGTLFEWKTVTFFAGLITIVDVIQVFVTKFMVTYSIKITDLLLPVMIRAPTFPYPSSMALGLGDFFLAGLLAIQTAKKYGRKFGYASVAFIAAVFLIFQAFQLWYFELLKQSYPVAEAATKAAMPATVFVVCGWLLALGVRYLYNELVTKKAVSEKQ